MLYLKNDDFESTIKESKNPVLVDFWAEWCGPCKMMAPVLEKVESDRDDITVAKVNVDESPELAIKYGIMSIPAFFLFKDGEVASKTIGYMSGEELLTELGL